MITLDTTNHQQWDIQRQISISNKKKNNYKSIRKIINKKNHSKSNIMLTITRKLLGSLNKIVKSMEKKIKM